MTDILCNWLNDELKISQSVEQSTFAREFASGYLIGEVLSKHQLQDDFDLFSQGKTNDSKLNNFTRLEPVLHLLGIPFDTNLARDVMTEKHGVATRLMYQLYIALNNKKKANLTGVAMETMRPAAPAKLNSIESGMYKERLKHLTPRQTDLNLETLVRRFHQHQLEMEKTAFKERFLEQERIRERQQEDRRTLLERTQFLRSKQSEMVAKIQAAAVHIPKPPPSKTAKAIQMRKEMRRTKEAQEMIGAISVFEDKMKMMLPPSQLDDDTSESIDLQYILTRDEDKAIIDQADLIRPKGNDDYINKIRKRLKEDAQAREEREKRRRKVLVDQMNAHEAQEEARREEMMVNRLMRQSQQERRISVQLLQARHEKDIIRRNRIFREKQYEERRLQDFEDALNREAEMARLAKLEYLEQTKKDQELHDQIAAQRAEERYKRHYDMCNEVVNQIVDFGSKIAEYRELTSKLLPPKLMREWKALFVNGMPLFEQTMVESTEPTPEQILEEERQQLLDEGDFMEYKNMVGEWQPPETADIKCPPRDNPIVGHIIQRLMNLVHPPTPPPQPPEFPPFPIKACILGKVFSGKTTCIQRLVQEHRLQVLVVDMLVNDAVEAHKNGELVEVPSAPDVSEEKKEEQLKENEETKIEEEVKPAEEAAAELAEREGQTSTPTAAAAAAEQPPGETSETPAAPAGTEPASTPAEGREDGASELAGSQPAEGGTPAGQALEASTTSVSSLKKRQGTKPSDEPPKPKPSERAKLGAKALKFLRRGKPVEDNIIVEVLVEAIRRIPEGTGWIIDGFPQTFNQAKLLEKALSGYDASAKEQAKGPPAKDRPRRKSSLVPDPRPPPPPPEPVSGINVVIVYDIPDAICLKRAAGRSYAIQADEQFHQEFKPPPEGSATGVGKQEQVIPVQDAAHDQEQIQHRITNFLDNWSKLEKWFTRFGTLKRIDASEAEETVYLETEKILEDTVAKILGKDIPEIEEPADAKIEEKVEEEPPPPPPEPVVEPPPEVPPEEDSQKKESVRPSSSKGSRSGSAKRSASRASSKDKKDKRDKSESPKRSGSGKKSDRSHRGSSPKSPKRGKSGKKSRTPEPESELELEVPAGPPPPQPGSEEWEFVDLPIEPDLAEILSTYWDDVEKTYVSNSKHVFRKIREERENIYRYFFQIRKDFLAYLRRPDHKQEFVSAWQKDYNSVPDDMRDDEETRCELHQRVDDLRERLWNICDERKEQAEKERETVMTDGWLDDRMGVLSNFYITMMQAEVDRFQDTLRLMKDYYRGMDGQIPDELLPSYARIPLIELPVERPESPDKSMGSDASPTPSGNEETTSTTKSDRSKSPKERGKSPRDRNKSPKDRSKSPKDGRKSRTPSAGKRREKSKDKDKNSEQQLLPPDPDGSRKRIPLVPRRPLSPDPDSKPGTTKSKDAKGKAASKKGTSDEVTGSESPAPPVDPDEKLVYDAAQNGLTAIGQLMAAEVASREAEEEAEKQKELEKEKEKEKAKTAAKKNAKKGKSRSPSPKKGKKEDAPPTPTPPIEEESEEEKQAKLQKSKMREEYYFSIQEEEAACKTRIELIKALGIAILQDLKNRGDNAYKDMNDWLGARFLKEMESIDHLSEVMRNTIESRQKIKQELELKQQDFLLNEDLKVLRSPTPPPPPAPKEEPLSDQFTVNQLMNLFYQFASTAPTGILSNKTFVETFENLVAVTHGMEQLPDMWMNITPGQIQEIEKSLSAGSEYVDWRRLLIALMDPIPVPTQAELLATLQTFQEMDQKQTGYVTREQYDRMNLWFSTENPEPDTFHRVANLKASLFDIFADFSRDPPALDYVSMLMYFSAAPNALHGFLRALSVAAGTHMPRLEKPQIALPPALELEKSTDDTHTTLNELTDFEEKMKAQEGGGLQEEIPPDAINAMVPLEALYKVLHHGDGSHGDSHRFSVAADPEEATSWERLAAVYVELGSENLEPLPYKILVEHPLIQDVITACKSYHALDYKTILSSPVQDNVDAHSTKTSE